MRPRFLSLVLDDATPAAFASLEQRLGPHKATFVADLASLKANAGAWRALAERGHDIACRLPLRVATSDPLDSKGIQQFVDGTLPLLRDVTRGPFIARVPDPLDVPVPRAELVVRAGGGAFANKPENEAFPRIRPWTPTLESEAELAFAKDVLASEAAPWLVVALERAATHDRLPAFLEAAIARGWIVRSLGEVHARGGPPSPYEQLTELCGELERPGAAIDSDHLVDYVERRTTPDQLRIEDVLEHAKLDGRDVLHVGIGNSSLAKRFASRARRIEGLTVAGNELKHAEKQAIPNYRVHLMSKYGRALQRLEGPFDVIVDNNLASFACCKYHLYAMFDAYVALLRPGGCIYTDLAGMQWSASDPRWKLSFHDLLKLERKLPIVVARVTSMVFTLTKLARG